MKRVLYGFVFSSFVTLRRSYFGAVASHIIAQYVHVPSFAFTGHAWRQSFELALFQMMSFGHASVLQPLFQPSFLSWSGW